MFSLNLTKARASISIDAPEPGIPDQPALLSDGERLWLAYHTPDRSIAVVRFDHVIDHRLAPIPAGGLGKHPYASAGLQFYTFHELTGTKETKEWGSAGGRHWVVTFKDVTLDVIAERCMTVGTNVMAKSPLEAVGLLVNS